MIIKYLGSYKLHDTQLFLAIIHLLFHLFFLLEILANLHRFAKEQNPENVAVHY
jgi:hypothetical protein